MIAKRRSGKRVKTAAKGNAKDFADKINRLNIFWREGFLMRISRDFLGTLILANAFAKAQRGFVKFKRLIPWLAITTAIFSIPSPAVFAQPTFGNERSHCQATLTANEPNSRITLRSGAGSNYRSLGYGLVGDRVQVLTLSPPELDYQEDSQGRVWYRVGFPRSGAKGWIRADLLRMQCIPIND